MLLILLVACSHHTSADQKLGECVDSPSPVALDETTDLGFAAADVLAYAQGDHTILFSWGGTGESDGTLTVTPSDDSADFVSSVPAEGGDDASCADRIDIPVTIGFTLDGGYFDETWDTALSAFVADQATFFEYIPGAAFYGTVDVTEYIPDDADGYDSLDAQAAGTFSADAVSGTLTGDASGSYDCDTGECGDWDETFDFGSWSG